MNRFLLTAFFLTSFIHPQGHNNELLHLEQATHEYHVTGNSKLFARRKSNLQTYYADIYEDDVREICRKAHNHFATIPATKTAAVIFDVDDTSLYNYHWHSDARFIWGWSPTFLKAHLTGYGPAIQPVLELYQFLIARGFSVIFVTARAGSKVNSVHTINELNAAGYATYADIIFRPPVVHPRSKGAWKYSVRQELAKKYTIVGCVGDKDSDFEGGLTGYQVRLPNYLY